MNTVNTNYAAMVAQNNVTQGQNVMTTAMERLSSGLRINGADDDAAGLQLAGRLNADLLGLERSGRNISEASSMMQTADGALDEITKIAERQLEITTQAANGVNSSADLKALNAEFGQLKTEINRIVNNTEYAGKNVLNKFDDGVTFQIGPTVNDDLDVQVNKLDTSVLDAIDIEADANAGIDVIDDFLSTIGDARSTFGTNINRLEHTQSNIANVLENTEMGYSRIMSADFAKESSNMARGQLMTEMSTYMLNTANQSRGLVVGLLNFGGDAA